MASSSTTTTALLSNPTSLSHFKRIRTGILFNAIPIQTSRISSTQSLNQLFFKNNSNGSKRNSSFTSITPFSPVMEWQDCTVKKEVNVPASVAYNCYSDREAFPRWMPFISSVEIVEGKPDQSRWSLKYKAFGQDIQLSWVAKHFQPIPNQKIHWRSLDGLPNRGVVRFFPKGPSSCTIEITVFYEVPQILTPVASAVKPFLEGLVMRGLDNFTKVAESYEAVTFHHPKKITKSH